MRTDRLIIIDEMFISAYEAIWQVIKKHDDKVEYFEVNKAIIQLLDRFNTFESKDYYEKSIANISDVLDCPKCKTNKHVLKATHGYNDQCYKCGTYIRKPLMHEKTN